MQINELPASIVLYPTSEIPIDIAGITYKTTVSTLAGAIDSLTTNVQTAVMSYADQSIAAGAIKTLNFQFTVPDGYAIVGACDQSYLATAFGVPILIRDDGLVTFNYFSPSGITSQTLRARAFFVKV